MISGYINSVPFPVYNCGEINLITTSYYIKWLPSYISSGTFTLYGVTYAFSAFPSGQIRNIDSVITTNAFSQNSTITSIETNATVLDRDAFNGCSSLLNVSASECTLISAITFLGCYSLSQIYFPVCQKVSNIAFADCRNLTEVDLPACSIVGTATFDNCVRLTSVNLPVCKSIGRYAFSNCYTLKEITLPAVEYIDAYAFTDCSEFSSITLPGSSVAFLDNTLAFYDTKLTSNTGYIFVPSSLVSSYETALNWSEFYDRITSIGANPSLPYNIVLYPGTLSGTFTINGKTLNYSDYKSGSLIHYDTKFSEITQSAFQSTNISSLYTDMDIIGKKAFYNCQSLTSANLERAIYVGSQAFEYCINLSYLSIPHCKSVGERAFLTCYSLSGCTAHYLSSHIYMPDCSYVGVDAFRGCKLVEYVTLSSSCIIGNGAFYACNNLKSVYGYECTSIGKDAFRSCHSLSIVSFKMCSYVGDGAFENCSSLTYVSLPSCTHLGGAFRSCYNLSSVYIPLVSLVTTYTFEQCKIIEITLDNCSYIAEKAFWYANVLQKIILKSNTVCTLESSDAFYHTGITSSTGYIRVPSSLVSDYKAASDWSYFKNRIFSIS